MNKIDALTDDEVKAKVDMLRQATGKKVFAMSAVARQGVYECLRELNQYITRKRQKNGSEDTVIEGVKKTWSPLD